MHHKFCSRDCYETFERQKNSEKFAQGAISTPKVLREHLIRLNGNICTICNLSNVWNEKALTLQLDHIDGNRANNKLNNLRIVTRQQNNFNRINTKGVSRLKKNGKWYAQIVLNGKKIHLGYFYLEEDAINAYKEAKKKYHIIDGHCYSTS